MRVVFLDIDGVLNSGRTARAFRSIALQRLDPVAVALLHNIVTRANAQIVLSSTWRIGANWRELTARCLCGAGWPVEGFDSIFIDRTPTNIGGCRGNEIQHWIDAQDEPVDFIIIDDDSDMLDSQLDRFIRVDRQIGLSVDNWNRIAEIWPEIETR